MNNKIKISPIVWMVVSGILLLPAFLLHLGIHPFLEDESIRATVALEMMLSGDYFTPTLQGDLYFAKPPLYNWILILSYQLTGVVDEWSSRIPTVFFLFVFGVYIYTLHRRNEFSRMASLSIGLMYLTCGRILFWDSFLGLIDICFSWVMYMMMCEMYMAIRKKQWSYFYIVAYALASIGYLLKGFPAFVFMGITLLLCLYLHKSWKKILCWPHLMGMFLAAFILVTYYYLYTQNGQLDRSIDGLLDQSTRRTFLAKGIGRTILHLFTYPFENIYHFLPWSLFCLLLLKKGFVQSLQENQFVFFSALCFLFNIQVYWISPEVYPRYILMLIPMAFTVFYFFYQKELANPSWRLRILRYFFLGLIVGLPFFLGYALLDEKVSLVYGWKWKATMVMLMTILIAAFYFVSKSPRLLILVAMLFSMRIAFNLFVIPVRAIEDIGMIAKKDAQRIAQMYGDQDLLLYGNSIIDNTSTFYLEQSLGYIIVRDSTRDMMILDPLKYAEPPIDYAIVDSFLIRRDERYLYLVEKISKKFQSKRK